MKKILFHHIPGTGGPGLASSLASYYGQQVCPARYDHQITREMMENDEFVVFHGHFTRTTVELFREACPAAFVFTFVRHPFNRTISQYYQWTDRDHVRRELSVIDMRSPDLENRRALRAKFEETIFHLSLDDFLLSNDPDVNQVVDNLQSQYFTRRECPHYRRFNRAPLNALQTYDLVGVQELYGSCLRIVEAKLGLPPGTLDDEANVDADGPTDDRGLYLITPAQMALLECRTSYDLSLFHLCYCTLLRDHGGLLPVGAQDIDGLARLPVVTERVHARVRSG